MTLNLVPEAFASSTDSQTQDTESHPVQNSDSSTEHAPAEVHAEEAHAEESHIVLAPQTITHIGPLPITNTLITTWMVMAILIGLSFVATKKMSMIPSGIQNFFEMVVEGMYNVSKDLAQDRAKYFFPFIMTFFLFIVAANWFGLLPGVMTITKEVDGHAVPLIRPMNTDLNMTLGLAIVSVAITHFYAVKFLGVGGYLKKWFSLNPIMLFVGILELVSEFTKTISLSFRLFGNIFAGEVVLTTISGLFAYIAPLPFYLLEVLVGVVQAAVFMMLTLVFMVVLSDKHESH